ncbi:MAG: cation:proton antiporter subunit C, partial [Gemmatimonadetes bacterium]|nr:cation:proton antiporter subunit C [Gemmatimonadota bacterium]
TPMLVDGYGEADVVYSNPLPHVLILTAIVVGIATTSVGLALAVRIKEAYGTLEEDEITGIEAGIEPAGEAGG